MSYGASPPPKTAYGDSDFIKEEFTAQQPPSVRQPPVNRGPVVMAPNAAYAGPSGYPPSPANSMLASNQGPIDPQDITNTMQSMTPEDRIFLRSWRQDSFYYRVMPLAMLGTGGLYYYYHTKGLPHKSSRYLMVSVLSFIVGKMSYKGELERRLEKTPLNTPFIQALRRTLGVTPPISSMAEFSGETNQDFGGGWNAGGPQPTRPGPYGGSPGQFGQMPQGAYGQYGQSPYQPYDSDLSSQSTPPPPSSFGGEPPKSFTNYEELRAKNRGLLQK